VRLRSTFLMEHQVASKQELGFSPTTPVPVLHPGGTTTCWGTTCTTSCGVTAYGRHDNR
jgi:hypothetical protein